MHTIDWIYLSWSAKKRNVIINYFSNEENLFWQIQMNESKSDLIFLSFGCYVYRSICEKQSMKIIVSYARTNPPVSKLNSWQLINPQTNESNEKSHWWIHRVCLKSSRSTTWMRRVGEWHYRLYKQYCWEKKECALLPSFFFSFSRIVHSEINPTSHKKFDRVKSIEFDDRG